MGTVADIHDIEFCFVSGSFLIGRSDLFCESVNGIILYDTYGAATKTAAGDAGSEYTRNFPGQRCQKISFLTGGLVIIPQRNMGSVDQSAKLLQVAGI